MLKLLILVIIIGVIEDCYRPRMERCRGGMVLFYGRKKRKYIKLW